MNQDPHHQRQHVYYAVARGRRVGVFTDLNSLTNSVKKFFSPLYRKFKSKSKAEAWVAANVDNNSINVTNTNLQINNSVNRQNLSYTNHSLISRPRNPISRTSRLFGNKKKRALKASDLIGKRDVKRKYNNALSNCSIVNPVSSSHNISVQSNTRRKNNNNNNNNISNYPANKKLVSNNFLLHTGNNNNLKGKYLLNRSRLLSPPTFTKAPRSSGSLNGLASVYDMSQSPSSPNFKSVYSSIPSSTSSSTTHKKDINTVEPIYDYCCDSACGYVGTFDMVSGHEKTCSKLLHKRLHKQKLKAEKENKKREEERAAEETKNLKNIMKKRENEKHLQHFRKRNKRKEMAFINSDDFFISIVNKLDRDSFTFWDDIVEQINITINAGSVNLQPTESIRLKNWNTFAVKKHYKLLVSCGKIKLKGRSGNAGILMKAKGKKLLNNTTTNYACISMDNLIKVGNAQTKEAPTVENDEQQPNILKKKSRLQQQQNEERVEKTPGKKKSGKRTLRDIALDVEDLGVDNDPPLDEVQKRGLQAALEGKNIFITGVAGTGKSLLLRRIKYELKIKSKKVAVVAPTGIAAINIGGATINSFCGIGIPERKTDFRKMLNAKRREELKKINVWIVDEVSMLSGEMLDNIDSFMKTIRRSEQPFGGVQLILCGDFLQLPPVPSRIPESIKCLQLATEADFLFLNRGFAFQAKCWPTLRVDIIKLHTVHRQGGDGEMIRALQNIREGNITDTVKTFIADCSIRRKPLKFRQKITLSPPKKKRKSKKRVENVDAPASSSTAIIDLSTDKNIHHDIDENKKAKTYVDNESNNAEVEAPPVEEEHEIFPTKLFCKNIDVDKINQKELDALATKRYGTMLIQACDQVFNLDPDALKMGEQAGLSRKELSRQQQLTDHQNRTLQKFFSFCRAKAELQLKVGAQVLLIHNMSSMLSNGSRGVVVGAKSRTDVINFLKKIRKMVEKNKASSHENPYSGISFKSKKDLELDDLLGRKRYGIENCLDTILKDCKGFKVNADEPSAWKRYHKKWFYPIVQFDNGMQRIILPIVLMSKIEDVGISSRTQIPLTLGWAITIHRSQGMSIGNLEVDLKDVFAEGQTYVALSRATTKDGLYIKGFHESCVKTNRMCVAFENGEHNNIINWLDESRLTWNSIRKKILDDLKQQQNRVMPQCKCNMPAYRGTVKKTGANNGRKFLSCAKGYKSRDRCNFFKWDS